MENENWRSMTREEFDRDHAQGFINGGILFPWCLLTWKERIVRVVLVFPLMGLMVLAGLGFVMWLLGTMIEVASERATELSRCQKRAATPYDYNQCK